MEKLEDFIGRKVLIIMREADDYEGILLSIENGGYFLRDPDDSKTYHFIPEQGNVLGVQFPSE